MTNKQKTERIYPLCELRVKHGMYKVVKNGFGHWSEAIIIGIGRTYSEAWKQAREYAEREAART